MKVPGQGVAVGSFVPVASPAPRLSRLPVPAAAAARPPIPTNQELNYYNTTRAGPFCQAVSPKFLGIGGKESRRGRRRNCKGQAVQDLRGGGGGKTATTAKKSTNKKHHKKKHTPPPKPTSVRLKIAPTGLTYICVDRGVGTPVLFNNTTSSPQTFKGKRLRVNIGDAANARVFSNGKKVPITTQAISIGWEFTPTKSKPLPVGQRRPCA